jgi:hypothetical protein
MFEKIRGAQLLLDQTPKFTRVFEAFIRQRPASIRQTSGKNRQTSGKHPASIRQTSGKHPANIRQTSGRESGIGPNSSLDAAFFSTRLTGSNCGLQNPSHQFFALTVCFMNCYSGKKMLAFSPVEL